MLISLSALQHWRIEATDGEVGAIVDVLFDDLGWNVRYLVVETGGWLSSRRVLLPPGLVQRHPGEFGLVRANLDSEQIRSCPDVDTDKSVSRAYEIELHKHYDYPVYWSPGLAIAGGPLMTIPPGPADDEERGPEEEAIADAEQSHLRSSREVIGYRVEASDGDAGDLDDMAVDDDSWSIPYLVVDTKRWRPGGRILVDAAVVRAIHYADAKVVLNRHRAELQRAIVHDAGPRQRL